MPNSVFFRPLALGACLLLLILLQLPAMAQTGSLNEDNGFMEYTMGGSLDSLPPLLRNGRTQKMDRYRVASDSIYFRDIPITKIELMAFQGRLHSLVIKTGTEAATNDLLAYFEDRYGQGERRDAMGTQLLWRAERLQLFFDRNIISNAGQFQFISVPVHKDYELYMYELQYGKVKKKKKKKK